MTRLMGLASALGVSHRVILFPPLPQSRLADVYAAADVVLVPSRSESFGLVALEAQACGTRVVAVRGGGLESTLAGETPPSLAASAAPSDLSAAVRAALALRETPEDRARRRARVVERFSSARTQASMLALYRRLIAERAARAGSTAP